MKREARGAAANVFELSSLMAMSAMPRSLERAMWLSRCARAATRRTGQLFAAGLLDHYRVTLGEIRETGYLNYWTREFRPYLRAAAQQFSASHRSLTERLLQKRRSAGL